MQIKIHTHTFVNNTYECQPLQESIFKYYTQKSCIYECTLTNVVNKVVSKLENNKNIG
jgi:hypothetical protein